MTTLHNGTSTYVLSTKPAYEFKSQAKLRLQHDPATSWPFLLVTLPLDLQKGATILSATLRLFQTAGWAGDVSMSIHRVASTWKVSTINYRNKPPAAAGSAALTLVQTDTLANGPWAFDVAKDVQAAVGEGRAPSWYVTTTEPAVALYLWGFGAAQHKPELEVTWAYPPSAPTNLHPSSGAVASSKPRLVFDAGDISALEVQLDRDANAVSPAFDSGWVSSTLEEYDLSTSTYSGVLNNSAMQWRVRVKDEAGIASPWSQWAGFTRLVHPTITITSPGGSVSDLASPITFAMSDIQAYRVIIAKTATPRVYLWDTGKHIASSLTVTPPNVFTQTNVSYTITARGWDSVDREATPGDPLYSETSITTALVTDPGGPAVAWVKAVQDFPAPWVDVKWGWSGTAPQGWAVLRNGEVIQVFETGSDAYVGSNVYEWRDWSAPCNRELVYDVEPVVGSVTSGGGPTDTITPRGAGVWLGDPETGNDVLILGGDEVSATYGEDSTTYNPIGATSSIRIVSSLRGLEGDVTGLVSDVFGRLAVDEIANLYDFKGRPGDTFRLVWADVNVPVTLLALTPGPRRAGTNTGGITRSVVFNFLQAGELPFSVT